MASIQSILGPQERRRQRMILAIGLVATRWTQVELATQQILANLARVDEQLGLAIATHIGDRTAIHVILTMSRQYSNLGRLGELIELYTVIHDICRENRNLLVHGNHVMSEKGISPEIHIIQRLSARGRLKVENLELTHDLIIQTAVEIAHLANFGGEIIGVLIAAQDEKVPKPLHQPPSKPTKLLDSLRRVPSDEILRPRPDGRKWADLEIE